MTHASELAPRALEGDRRSLGRLLSLVEDDPLAAAEISEIDGTHSPGTRVVGITGAPGSGKSTLTNRLVVLMRERSETVAVIAVDPTSPFSGGALLGDRIRMNEHASDGGVYIRSMANRGHLGGISAAVPQAVRVLRAAGFEWILLETVGVGQVEVEIASQADLTIVVLTPGWGDHVQASKAGLLEVADLFVVNKADRPGARTTVRDLRTELTLGGPTARRPPILETQAHNGEGVAELDATVQRLYEELALSGELEDRRTSRLRAEIIQQATTLRLVELSGAWSDDLVGTMVQRVRAGELTALAAARELANLTSPG